MLHNNGIIRRLFCFPRFYIHVRSYSKICGNPKIDTRNTSPWLVCHVATCADRSQAGAANAIKLGGGGG